MKKIYYFRDDYVYRTYFFTFVNKKIKSCALVSRLDLYERDQLKYILKTLNIKLVELILPTDPSHDQITEQIKIHNKKTKKSKPKSKK